MDKKRRNRKMAQHCTLPIFVCPCRKDGTCPFQRQPRRCLHISAGLEAFTCVAGARHAVTVPDLGGDGQPGELLDCFVGD